MENYVWLAIGAAASLAIFLIWVWRGRPLGESPRLGLEGPIAVVAENTPAPPGIVGDRPPA